MHCFFFRFAVFSYYETCASNRHKCPSSAECRDYKTGYCCHCKPGFYGNGKECIADGTLIFSMILYLLTSVKYLSRIDCLVLCCSIYRQTAEDERKSQWQNLHRQFRVPA